MKVSLGKDQKVLPSFSQSNQKKTNVMVAKSSKDGKEAYPCVKVERPRPSRTRRRIVLRDQPAVIGWYTVLLAVLKVKMFRPTLR